MTIKEMKQILKPIENDIEALTEVLAYVNKITKRRTK
jgi:hypothetical protein